MRVTWTGARFEASVSGQQDRDILKRDGFHFDDRKKVFWTGLTHLAKKYQPYADHRALYELNKENVEIDASRATESSSVYPAPEGKQYLPFQVAGIDYLRRRTDSLLADEMGLGKAQPVTQKVVTEDGWKQLGDLKVGEKIYGSTGQLTEVEGVFPQGMKEVFKVTFTDNTSTECCDEHLWAVSSPEMRFYKQEPKIKELSEIRGWLFDAAGNKRYFIPLTFPVMFPDRDLPVDPYLLGVLLGDGSIKYGTDFTSADDFIVGEVQKIVSELGLVVRKTGQNDGIDYRICQKEHTWKRNILKEKLQVLGLFGHGSGSKFIPDLYLIGSLPQRISLIQGLLDTDGYVSKEGTIQFNSTSEKLAQGFAELVYSIGGTARINPYAYQYKDNPEKISYAVTSAFPDGFFPFRLPRKLDRHKQQKKYKPYRAFKSVEFAGIKETVCIKVKALDQLYLTDNYIVTHNTIQGIGVINAEPDIKKVLVIPPAFLRLNWRKELLNWLTRPMTGGIAIEKNWPTEDIVICNYENVKKFRKQIDETRWDLLLGDETHYLKNPESQRTKAVLGGEWQGFKNADPIDAGMRIFATGTPVLNHPSELWPILRVIDRTGLGTDQWAFYNRYCTPKETALGWDLTGADNLDELQHRLRSRVMLRRLKRDVLKWLPPKRRQVVPIPAKTAKKAIEDELKLYEQNRADVEDALRKAEEARSFNDESSFLEVVNGLKKTRGVLFQEMARLRKVTATAKIPFDIEYIEDILDQEEKLVVFAHHHEVVEALYNHFKPIACYMHGGCNDIHRQMAVDEFQDGNHKRLIIGTIGTMGVGWTLTRAFTSLFVEECWVPAFVTQAEDRLHRIGQLNAVLALHLVFDGSLDANMAQKCVAKQEVIDATLD